MFTAHAEQGWGIVDQREPWRIAVLIGREQGNTDPATRLDFTFGFGERADFAGSAGAAAPRQFRKALKGGFGAAAMIDERAKGARPDMFAADQPQPVDALGVAQPDGHRCEPVHDRFPLRAVLRKSGQGTMRVVTK